eukprot:GEMP01067815.1.p2 GENE.GEMP01067815.1~~GEMP01067815.1.p2  ORF type:complete len:155 (-),score=33.26 GEMP01067815.1:62-526(-)
MGFSAFKPVPKFCSLVESAVRTKHQAPYLFHHGNHYRFGEVSLQITEIQDLKENLGEIDSLFVESGDLHSIWNAPQYHNLVDSFGSAPWRSIGQQITRGTEMALDKASVCATLSLAVVLHKIGGYVVGQEGAQYLRPHQYCVGAGECSITRPPS